MSEREQENVKADVIDPESDRDAGAAALIGTEVKPLDPPEGNGSGGGGKITTVNNS